ncbi:MAG: hypothetical protein ACRCUM_01340 [Mycoplasmoidaceae bacterium]
MKKIKFLKTSLCLILSTAVFSSILLTSCSNVVDNNVEPEVPVIPVIEELKILNNISTNINDSEYDIFLTNLINELENIILPSLEKDRKVSDHELISNICDVLNTKNIIKFNLENIDYTFRLEKNNSETNNQRNVYKIILKIDVDEIVNSIDFFGKKLLSNKIKNEFVFFENKNEDRKDVFNFDRNFISILKAKGYLSINGGVVGEDDVVEGPRHYKFDNELIKLIKHLDNLGIHNLDNFMVFTNDSVIGNNRWRIFNNQTENNDKTYNINSNYHYEYYDVSNLEGLKQYFIDNKIPSSSYDIIKKEDSDWIGYKIAFKISN